MPKQTQLRNKIDPCKNLHQQLKYKLANSNLIVSSWLLAGLLFIGILASFSACQQKADRTKFNTSLGADEFLKGAAPDFDLPDLSGSRRSLSEFRGKVVLLNFWALWCAPCVAEMPSLERLYQTHKNKGLEIVAVSLDGLGSEAELKRFVKKNGLSFSVLQDSEMILPGKYGVSGFPESFFIGPSGQFLSFQDPGEGKSLVRIISDRAWDSPQYVQAVQKLLIGAK